ncbi:P-loop containing nucleoside triphosphate hydrolase protein [Zopfia rhizophila CBS 207.26]|uniref:P-loop containing nucleoside triphosphate hydrolase protein n=1 Tax=Zopfia rhizophila CBS 207.26 TaxID=1314779 RepID=A0A6A6DTN4_9PEZI|nr:P-loop containing nucleoside triphosphate hydrolase protein [Zopfia rhizophila CBS 207.26]
MEAAGLVVGIAGLAGLFNVCSSAFKLVLKGRAFNKDYKILETKFSNQELRLRAWGRACGLIDGTQYDARLDEPELNRQLVSTLECINLLLNDAKQLKDRYGLTPCTEPTDGVQGESAAITTSSSSVNPGSRLERRSSLNRLLRRRSRSQQSRPNSKVSAAIWVIDDREKFAELVKHLKDFIDDLEDLTKATEIQHRQRIFIDYEIECIDDVEELEEIEMAREGEEDAVSDAASVRLEQISQGTASVRSSVDSGHLGSFITLESYYTARTHLSRTSSTAESGELRPVSTEQEIAVHEPNGKRLPSDEMQQELSSTAARRLSRRLSTTELPVATKQQPPVAIKQRVKQSYKCVVVGEASARKTQLLSTFTRGYYPTDYAPVIFDDCINDIRIDDQRTSLLLRDISGYEDYANLQAHICAGADVVIICLLLGASPDYDQVREKWAVYVAWYCQKARCILAGMEPDRSYRYSPSDFINGTNLAKEIGATTYVQCKLETGACVDDVFEAAIRAAISASSPPSRGFRLPWRSERPKLPIINETREEASA